VVVAAIGGTHPILTERVHVDTAVTTANVKRSNQGRMMKKGKAGKKLKEGKLELKETGGRANEGRKEVEGREGEGRKEGS
jgi:hypothetical protein